MGDWCGEVLGVWVREGYFLLFAGVGFLMLVARTPDIRILSMGG